MNKNIHFNLTIILLSSWLTGLLGVLLVQDKPSLAQEQIHKNVILEFYNFQIDKFLPKSIVGKQLLEEELHFGFQVLPNVNKLETYFDISNQQTKSEVILKSNLALPEKEALTEANIQTKTATAKSNSELVLAKTLELIKEFEGFRPQAYRDTDGTPVIGYGLSKVAGKKVRMGDRISTHQADAALKAEIYALQKQIKSIVKVKLNAHQLGALTSFAFNTGFYGLKNSTLLRKLNSGDHHGAANEFLRWNKAHSRGRLVPLAGLTRRRQAERELFLTVNSEQL